MWKSFLPSFSSQKYMDLAVADTENLTNPRTKIHASKPSPKIHRFYPLLITVLVTSTTCLFFANYYHLFTHGIFNTGISISGVPSAAESSSYTNCGSSPSVARSRGCSFDLLSFAWQMPKCYDEQLISSFLAHPPTPWRYYTNSSATEEVPPEAAALGETALYVTWEYHVVHCTFMWMQMHRAYTERGYIDSHLDNWEHTKHCQIVALDRMYSLQIVNVQGKVLYPDCRPVKGSLFPGQAGKAEDLSKSHHPMSL